MRPGAQTVPTYTRQQFGGQLGGPLKIPGVDDGTRTTFFLNYGGGRSNSLVDQYATVPTAAMRAGDFSGGIAPLDPLTGQPFPNGTIPAARIDPAARALLDYFPLPNLPGTAQNYRRTTTGATVNDNIEPAADAQLHGRGGARPRRPRRVRRTRRPRRRRSHGTAVVLNAQVQDQRGQSDR